MKAKTRKLVVDGVEYRWSIRHEHHVDGHARCRECFTAFRVDHRASPLRVRFCEGPNVSAGYPLAGTIFVGGLAYNLNLPRLAAAMIRLGLARGWAPEREALEVADGVEWLGALDPAVA